MINRSHELKKDISFRAEVWFDLSQNDRYQATFTTRILETGDVVKMKIDAYTCIDYPKTDEQSFVIEGTVDNGSGPDDVLINFSPKLEFLMLSFSQMRIYLNTMRDGHYIAHMVKAPFDPSIFMK